MAVEIGYRLIEYRLARGRGGSRWSSRHPFV